MFPALATVYGLDASDANSSVYVATVAITPNTTSNCPSHTCSDEKPIKNIISKMQTSDPVTQAIINNVAGKIPPVKKEQFKCDICKIEVSGEVVLKDHLSGAKHRKKLAQIEAQNKVGNSTETKPSQQIPAAVITSPTGVTKPVSSTSANTNTIDSVAVSANETKVVEICCKICNIFVNSQEQLDVHNAGKQHKKKSSPDYALKNPHAAAKNIEIDDSKLPECVTKKVEGTVITYTCTICNKWVNAPDQLQNHLKSRKHAFKTKGVFGERYTPYDSKKQKAKDTFSKFCPGGVLRQERRLGLGNHRRVDKTVQYPSFNANNLSTNHNYGFNSSHSNLNSLPGQTYNSSNNESYSNTNEYNSYGYSTNSSSNNNIYPSLSLFGFSDTSTSNGKTRNFGNYTKNSNEWNRRDTITPYDAKNYFNASSASQPFYTTQNYHCNNSSY